MAGRAHRIVTNCRFTVAPSTRPGLAAGRERHTTSRRSPRCSRRGRRASRKTRSSSGTTPTWPSAPCRNGRRPWTPFQELPEIGAGGPVGYWGLNMGTAIGVPLAAAEPRITAAVFGLHWPDALAEAARQITIPIEFDLQWDDEHIDRQSGLASGPPARRR